jgi:hypothetical protein
LMVPTIASLFAQGFSFSHLYSGFAVSAGIILVVVPLLPRYKLSKENPISVAT